MEPTIKTIDTKHVEYLVLHLAGSDLYGRRYYITGGLKVQGLGSEELTTIENENTVQ